VASTVRIRADRYAYWLTGRDPCCWRQAFEDGGGIFKAGSDRRGSVAEVARIGVGPGGSGAVHQTSVRWTRKPVQAGL